MIRTLITTVVFLLASQSAMAIPKLAFSGDVSFDVTTDTLSVSGGVLTPDFEGLSVTPVTDGSTGINTTVDFSAIFDRPTDLSDLQQGNFIVADFLGNGTATPDIVITADILEDAGSQSVTLLAGNFTGFTVRGRDGLSLGVVRAFIDVTSGISDFVNTTASELLAIEFNLLDETASPISFSTELYNQDFSAEMNGDITAIPVPEPGLLSMLMLGLILIGFTRNKNLNMSNRRNVS